MNEMTIIEKIIARRAGRERVSPGDNVWVDVDTLLTHDVCGPGSASIFKREFGEDARVWDRERVVIIPDHYIFTNDKHANRNVELIGEFAREQDLKYFYEPFTDKYKGVCHVALAEEGHTRPGEILFGTDSHTCTAGAFGQFASGIGNTDAAFIMGTGKLWVKVPESIKFTYNNSLPDYVMGKDVILHAIGHIGFDGGTYRCMEFQGSAIKELNIDERMTICNMAVEAGGKCGIIEADDKVVEFLRDKTDREYEIFKSDPHADYHSKYTFNGEEIEPLVAKPYSPSNVERARDLEEIRIDRAYIGSCTGGKATDFIAAARILKGRRVAVETFIIPATTQVEEDIRTMEVEGIKMIDIFTEAGCHVGKPSCGACLGGPADTVGRTTGNEVVISTTNRNFPGRMGSMDSKVYLASPLTAAASAIRGYITDPRRYM
ncbi:3-isopropylmalate dehydratase large subunit [Propionigenium maris DSM 9537]|uniref:3-isopropylmalate dehydratase large subunit n=1 Tax=Propionigenium maris DSM 9537 TaxID=1123000 RepID=A0A9W6GP94_9FUSO|nr:3-isopropylmalate dehydratase large subunit [Propionigenium maris]GLI57252.1 3-isopropylmalate dehydratase large subunit [Propionigenium maris DSM 9537]